MLLKFLFNNNYIIFTKVNQLTCQWEKSIINVTERKDQLETMLNECQTLEQINMDFMERINEIEQKVDSFPELTFGKDTLKKQKTEYKVYSFFYNRLF